MRNVVRHGKIVHSQKDSSSCRAQAEACGTLQPCVPKIVTTPSTPLHSEWLKVIDVSSLSDIEIELTSKQFCAMDDPGNCMLCMAAIKNIDRAVRSSRKIQTKTLHTAKRINGIKCGFMSLSLQIVTLRSRPRKPLNQPRKDPKTMALPLPLSRHFWASSSCKSKCDVRTRTSAQYVSTVEGQAEVNCHDKPSNSTR